jgi:transposase
MHLVADRGYSYSTCRDSYASAGSPTLSPSAPISSRLEPAGALGGGRPPKVDSVGYRQRNVVERAIARLKQHRAIATRYNKLAVTVTLLAATIRGVLKAADQQLEAELRGVLADAEEYASLAKPQIDWDDQAARAALVDARAWDAHAVLALLQGRWLPTAVAEAVRLLAAAVGQDLEHGTDGSFRIARKVAADRVISTVDPGARHGHKSSARGFDGYKGHASVDPDNELVMATAATAGNLGDAAAAPHLLAELVDQVEQVDGDPPASASGSVADAGPPAPMPTVYGDSAYGTGPLLASLAAAGIDLASRSRPRSRRRRTSPRTSSGSTWARAR